METVTRKPFYLRPPWNILFEFSKLEKLTPWNVNIAYLLRSFLSEMEKMGKVDFRASGVALDSSALIYLMKSKLLLTLQEPPAQPKPPGDFVPPPLFLPLRHELTSTTIQHLLEVLDDVWKGEPVAERGNRGNVHSRGEFEPCRKPTTSPITRTQSLRRTTRTNFIIS